MNTRRFPSLSPMPFLSVCLVVLSLALSGGHPARAQQTLADADWSVRQIGDGVVWKFYLFDNLFGSKQSVGYIEADLNNPNISIEFPYLASSRALTSTMITTQKPGAAGGINGTYFDTSVGGGGHETYLRVDNVEIPQVTPSKGAWSWEGGVAINTTGTLSIFREPPAKWSSVVDHPDIMANGPLLIESLVIQSAKFVTIGSHCTGRNPRSAVGVTADNRLILLAVDGRTEMAAGMTCEELAQTMQQLGCIDALNLDGGGSTTLWARNEPYSGVVNYPSDNGAYDHLGERTGSNAIAIVAPTPAAPAAWDARLTAKSFVDTMEIGDTQTVSFTYQNIGSQTWTSGDTRLLTARPDLRSSPFAAGAGWTSSSEPVAMSPATVAPGASATFSFTLKAPSVPSTTILDEYFELTQTGVGRIGPADSEAWMRLIVEPPPSGGASFLVESRAGGQNFAWYNDSGMADSGVNCTAPDATGTIGMRYGSTYRSVAGSKRATAAPNFPGTGPYKVYVAWGNAANRRSPITYKVTHNGGVSTFQIDQTLTPNLWYQLGTGTFEFNAGYGGKVDMTNENIDVSGSMYFGAVKFEFIGTSVNDWTLF